MGEIALPKDWPLHLWKSNWLFYLHSTFDLLIHIIFHHVIEFSLQFTAQAKQKSIYVYSRHSAHVLRIMCQHISFIVSAHGLLLINNTRKKKRNEYIHFCCCYWMLVTRSHATSVVGWYDWATKCVFVSAPSTRSINKHCMSCSAWDRFGSNFFFFVSLVSLPLLCSMEKFIFYSVSWWMQTIRQKQTDGNRMARVETTSMSMTSTKSKQ